MQIKKSFFYLLFLVLSIVTAEARAQDLGIGAWLENDHVIIKSEIDQKPLANAEITIFDANARNRLAGGRTDSAGFYAFPVPEVIRAGHGLIIDINAGNGLRKEWSLTAAELYAASSLTAGFDEAAISQQAPPEPGNLINIQQPEQLPVPANASPAPAGVTADEVKTIVNQLLQEQIEPLRQELKSRDKLSFSWQETLGGIGWLIGILGIILYFLAKRRS